jgi:hypothetical protein
MVGTDEHWSAVYNIVLEALLRDVELHKHPPEDEDEVAHVAETVADHLVGTFICRRRGHQ